MQSDHIHDHVARPGEHLRSLLQSDMDPSRPSQLASLTTRLLYRLETRQISIASSVYSLYSKFRMIEHAQFRGGTDRQVNCARRLRSEPRIDLDLRYFKADNLTKMKQLP